MLTAYWGLAASVVFTYFAHLWGFTQPAASLFYLFFGCLPLFYFLDRATSLRQAAFRGWLFGFISHLAVCVWMIATIRNFTAGPWLTGEIAGVAVWILISAFSGLSSLLLGWGWGLFRNQRGLWLLFAPFFVYVVERLMPKYFPNTIGQALYSLSSLRQIADLAGVWILTSLLITVNGCIYLALTHFKSRRQRAALLLGVCFLVGTAQIYGVHRLSTLEKFKETKRETLKIGLVQPGFNASLEIRYAFSRALQKRKIVEEMIKQTVELLASAGVDSLPDVIVWPETSYPDTFFSQSPTESLVLRNMLAEFLKDLKIPLWFGGRDQVGDDRYNTFYAAFWTSSGISRFAYHKRKLVALSESIPFSEFLIKLEAKTQLPFYTGLRRLGLSNFKPGDGIRLFTVQKGQSEFVLAPEICFEGLFPLDAVTAVKKGAQGFINLTNDSWFGHSRLSEQNLHLYLSAFRSIETHRPFFRATSTGISAVIDIDGTVQAASGTETREFAGVMEMPFSPVQEPTFFVKHPFLLLYTSIAMSIGLILITSLHSLRLYKSLFSRKN